MCGIAGIAGASINLEKTNKDVTRICKQMIHRGPDNTTIKTYAQAVFGHNRLSLVDMHERSNQPFENKEFALVFNGEIYNYLELKEELRKIPGIEFQTTSDTEVLFFGLMHWGLEVTLAKLKGMFAFAWYDFKLGIIKVARDRTGMKPFFYSTKNGQLAFASELKGLWCLSDYSNFNDKYISLATFGGYEYSRVITALTGVHQLEPGCYMEYDIATGKHANHPYFTMSDYVSESEYRRRDTMKSMDVHQEFQDLFTATIHKVMAADAKMGAFVSGGVDSSLCAGIAFQKNPISLFTSNVVGPLSEIENSRYLAKKLGTDLYKHDFTSDLFLKNWVKTTWYYESPILSHSNSIPFQFVSELAQTNACKAVLTGEGSDELFLGYPRLLTRRFDNLIQLPFNLVTSVYKQIPGLKRYLNLDKNNFQEDFSNLLTGFEYEKKESKNLQAYSFLKNPETRVDQATTLNMLERTIHSLLWRNDRMGMMHSIESRFPFLYEDVLEFAVNLPVKYKVSLTSRFHNFKHPFLIDKYIVRNLTEKVLDKNLAYIQKKGFPVIGLMAVKVEADFFSNGFWQTHLGLNPGGISELKRNADPYLLAKLASVDIWGSLFFLNQSIEEVEERVARHITLAVK